MQRAIEYIVFFVAVVLLQALLFDNMMFSGLVVPLYYVVFVVLLPVKIGRGWLLLLGVLLGVVMDMSMGTAGINTIATSVSEEAGTLEDVYEPFLIKEGFLKRTPRGREATDLAYSHLGYSKNPESGVLF